ncbi:hypothetical protein [Micromonospora sp. WMMA1996]|uniref:hypothetical protein n=1 Tax=Micromonospora sp. WMMA1996 TaxID=2039878 RepID=UPI00159BC2AC|nr:hypothetical protein [Micromonospora sp. WMMA1996]
MGKKNRYPGPRVNRPYRTGPEQADRLTLLTEWRNFVPERPVVVQAGETIWVEDFGPPEHRTPQYHLVVRRKTGQLDAYPGDLCR